MRYPSPITEVVLLADDLVSVSDEELALTLGCADNINGR